MSVIAWFRQSSDIVSRKTARFGANIMKIPLWRFTLFVALCCSCVLWAKSGQSPQSPSLGGLKGQIGFTRKDGTITPPTSATVYVMYGSELASTSFSRAYDTNTAGAQYGYRLNKLLGPVSKHFKTLKKSGQRDEIAKLVLRCVDEAITATNEWAAKRSERLSQIKTSKPDAEGVWQVEGLASGPYEVVVRGTVAGVEADWEATVDLSPAQTISLPLTTPRFFYKP